MISPAEAKHLASVAQDRTLESVERKAALLTLREHSKDPAVRATLTRLVARLA